MTETGSNFTLNESGTLTSTISETGNTITGAYTHTEIGTDHYTMVETGVNTSSQVFCQTIAGSETYTITITGNSLNQTFNRATTGMGTYSETMVVIVSGAPVTSTPSGS